MPHASAMPVPPRRGSAPRCHLGFLQNLTARSEYCTRMSTGWHHHGSSMALAVHRNVTGSRMAPGWH
eukprot:10105592-Karenia_brevis.AAC.1